MSVDRHSRQAADILRGLCDFPGGKEVSIMSRRLPRVLPAEAGTGFLQEERSFALGDCPAEMPAELRGMDEVTITLFGEIPDGDAGAADISHVIDSARSLLSDAQAEDDWEIRSKVKRPTGLEGDDARETRQAYQITLFADVHAMRETDLYA